MELSLLSPAIVFLLGYLIFFWNRGKFSDNPPSELAPLIFGLGLGALILVFGAIDLLTNLF